jgi:hypothetical protein
VNAIRVTAQKPDHALARDLLNLATVVGAAVGRDARELEKRGRDVADVGKGVGELSFLNLRRVMNDEGDAHPALRG